MRFSALQGAALGVAILAAACQRAPEPNDRARAQGSTATPAAAPAPQEQAGQALAATAVPAGEPHPALRNPALATETAPATYAVEFNTAKGNIIIDVTRAWAPLGADRFYNLVKIGYFTDVAFFRVIEGFMAQAGLHGDPEINRVWRDANIQDDPVTQRNTRGMVSFATAGPNTRTNQFFINFGDNSRLDGMGFAPFGRVRDMAIVDRIHNGYGEGAPMGRGPSQGRIQSQGNTYLRSDFPDLDYIRSARILP